MTRDVMNVTPPARTPQAAHNRAEPAGSISPTDASAFQAYLEDIAPPRGAETMPLASTEKETRPASEQADAAAAALTTLASLLAATSAEPPVAAAPPAASTPFTEPAPPAAEPPPVLTGPLAPFLPVSDPPPAPATEGPATPVLRPPLPFAIHATAGPLASKKPEAAESTAFAPPSAAPTMPDAPASLAPPPVQPLTAAGPAMAPAAPVTTATAAPRAIPPEAVPMTIASYAREGAKTFEIRLDPAELGRVDVRLSIDHEGAIRTHIVVERPETLLLLRNDSPRLDQAFADAGLKAENASFSLRGDSGQDQRPAFAPPANRQTAATEDEPAPPAAHTIIRAPSAASRIDLMI